jgi:membrane protease YdiL (CAAX protease family)
MALSNSPPPMSVRFWNAPCLESDLMDTLSPEHPPVTVTPGARQRRVWKFWGTLLWGLFVFAAMFIGQLLAIVYVILQQHGPFDVAAATKAVGTGLTISLSVMTGLPAVLAALWLPIHLTRTSFADYLGLRRPSWKHVVLGAVGLAVIVGGWDAMSRLTDREIAPGFMTDVFKSAEASGAVWLLVIAFCVAAPIAEELFARGFLYRGWSETALRPVGAIVLSSAVWTAVHLQYEWYFFGEIFTIGVWLGFLRYRFQSTWTTSIVHGLNNLAAVIQTMWLASQS